MQVISYFILGGEIMKNFYHNGKSRDFNLIYEKKTKRFILYSKSSKKLYSSNYLNEVLHYIKMLQWIKYQNY